MQEKYLGHYVAEFHVGHDEVDEILAKLLRGGTFHDDPTRMPCKDGAIKHLLIHSNAPVTDGEFIDTCSLMRDVADRVRLGEKSGRKLHELADIDRHKAKVLAMPGYELRNPLDPFMNFLELMRMGGHDATPTARSCEIFARRCTAGVCAPTAQASDTATSSW